MMILNNESFEKIYQSGLTIHGKVDKFEESYPIKLILEDSSFVKPKLLRDKLGNIFDNKRQMEIDYDNSDTLYFRTTIKNKTYITVNRGKLICQK